MRFDFSQAANTFARELANKFTPTGAAAVCIASIVGVALVFSSATLLSNWLVSGADIKKAEISARVRMAELDLAKTGLHQAAVQTENARAAIAVLERAHEREVKLIGYIKSLEQQSPVVQYAMAEADLWRPALLNLAPHGGSIDFNGLTLDAKVAKALAKSAAKASKQARKAKKSSPIDNGWVTTVKRGNSISS